MDWVRPWAEAGVEGVYFQKVNGWIRRLIQEVCLRLRNGSMLSDLVKRFKTDDGHVGGIVFDPILYWEKRHEPGKKQIRGVEQIHPQHDVGVDGDAFADFSNFPTGAIRRC